MTSSTLVMVPTAASLGYGSHHDSFQEHSRGQREGEQGKKMIRRLSSKDRLLALGVVAATDKESLEQQKKHKGAKVRQQDARRRRHSLSMSFSNNNGDSMKDESDPGTLALPEDAISNSSPDLTDDALIKQQRRSARRRGSIVRDTIQRRQRSSSVTRLLEHQEKEDAAAEAAAEAAALRKKNRTRSSSMNRGLGQRDIWSSSTNDHATEKRKKKPAEPRPSRRRKSLTHLPMEDASFPVDHPRSPKRSSTHPTHRRRGGSVNRSLGSGSSRRELDTGDKALRRKKTASKKEENKTNTTTTTTTTSEAEQKIRRANRRRSSISGGISSSDKSSQVDSDKPRKIRSRVDVIINGGSPKCVIKQIHEPETNNIDESWCCYDADLAQLAQDDSRTTITTSTKSSSITRGMSTSDRNFRSPYE